MKVNQQHEGDNIGGISKLEVGFTHDFANFNPVIFLPSKYWQEIVFHPSSGLMKQDVVDSDHGIYYTYAGTIKITHRDAAMDQLLDSIVGHKTLVRITDMNGYTLVIGTPDSPVLFTQSGDTGSAPTDVNHYVLSFSVSQLNRALFG